MIRRWLGRELVIDGRQIYIVDDGVLVDRETSVTPLEHVLAAFLRTRTGQRLESAPLRAWSLAQEKIALAAIVTRQSRLSGIDVMDAGQLGRFLAETRDAASKDALQDLAQRFKQKWQAANYLAYVHLRASASATVL